MDKLAPGFRDDYYPWVGSRNDAFSFGSVEFLAVVAGVGWFEFVRGKTETVAGFLTSC